MASSRRRVLLTSGIAAVAGLLLAFAIAPATAGGVPAVTGSAGGCGATAHIDSQWGTGTAGGQIVTATVVNTAASSATTWTVTWSLASGQRVVSSWNATISTSGTAVTAVNAAYNGALAPGGSTSFGMQLAGTGPVPVMSCANDAAPPASSSATPPAADLTLTQADNQTSVTLLVGQTLGVSLSADFRPTTVSGPALTPLSTSGGYPTGQPLTALYRASAAGTVDISSQTDYACLHSSPSPPPCARPIMLWLVHITVVGPSASATGQTVTVTTAANKTTVALRVGDTLVVSLPSMYVPPTVAPGGVLTAGAVTGGYPTTQPLLASYVATAPGQVDVSSITDGACLHQPTPCPSPQVPWTVHVTVAS